MIPLYKSRWMRVRETGFEYIEQICAICGKANASLGAIWIAGKIDNGGVRLRHAERYKYPGIWFCNKKCKEKYGIV